MSEKRFDFSLGACKIYDKQEERLLEDTEVCGLLNEQQDNLDELEKNFDDLVKWASEIAQRNVLLDEKIGKIQRENEQLRTQLLICQQSKNDDGRFQVWEVPPITMGKRISFTKRDDLDE